MKLTEDTIQEQVRSYILEAYLPGECGKPLRYDSDLLEFINSLQLLRMVIELESMFGVSIEEEDMAPENLGSIERIAEYVRLKRG